MQRTVRSCFNNTSRTLRDQCNAHECYTNLGLLFRQRLHAAQHFRSQSLWLFYSQHGRAACQGKQGLYQTTSLVACFLTAERT